MQKIKTLVVGIAATVTIAGSAGAQEARLFENSWFWGVKSGFNTFSTAGRGSSTTAGFGLDWFITRSKGGLYVSYDQAGFERDVQVFDFASETGERTVRVNDLRRITVAALAYPRHFGTRFGTLTPYGGIGYSISAFGDARILRDSVNSAPNEAFFFKVDDRRSRGAVVAMGGLQMQRGRVALFAQETLLPSSSEFLVRSVISLFELGVRYNFGSSIDRGTGSR